MALVQFNQHCNEHQLFPDFQSMYRHGYSTETSLIKMVNDLLWGMEKKEITAIIILDMLAAFDTFDYDLLLTILQNRYGITWTTLQWYQSYLRHRGMRVCINDAYYFHLSTQLFCPSGKCKWSKPFYGLLYPNRICNTCWHHYQ